MDTHSIGGMIKILSEAINQQMNANCKEFNLTMQQTKILRFLKLREGKQISSQKDIQDYMRTSHPTTVHTLRLLKEKGFVTISTSEKDKRMRIVTLTGQEESFFKQVIASAEDMEKRLLNGLSDEELADLRRYLKHLYMNIYRPAEQKTKGEINA